MNQNTDIIIDEKKSSKLKQLPICPPAPKKGKIQLYCHEKINWDFLSKQT